ncbi:hypothetical protein HY404_02760 [Candidatus Microgenomates bacterium]|nr:hypothetical protein [Candidatus Microgenomates bacterium]
MNYVHHWKYKNLTIALTGIILAIILSQIEAFHYFLLHLGSFGYVGLFIGGMLFTSMFTAATSILIISTLAENISPLTIGLIGGAGAVIGDLLILNLIKDNLAAEIESVYDNLDSKGYFKKLFHSKYFNWMLPVIGAMIIVSPLPDELGISLIGLSNISKTKFILLSYFLNSLGIFLIASASMLIRL